MGEQQWRLISREANNAVHAAFNALAQNVAAVSNAMRFKNPKALAVKRETEKN